jgi:two-component system, chemotaxis family, chemotaxis protein CheY
MARILLVDDDQGVRESIRGLLKAYGHTVVVAVDGEDGLNSFIDTGPYDLIVSDYQMPNMDGLELLAAVRADLRFEKPVPFILMSGNTALMNMLTDACRKFSATLCVKPALDFMDKVDQALGTP